MVDDGIHASIWYFEDFYTIGAEQWIKIGPNQP